jgi:hypothetical protein
MTDSMTLRDLIPRSESDKLWRQEGDKLVMPRLQSEFLDWLLTHDSEREHHTIKDWSAAHGVAATRPALWKKDRRFRREWEDRAAAKNISVDRLQNVIDTLYEAACNGDVNAAKLYMAHVEKLRPSQVVEPDRDVERLSDDELQAEIRGLLEGGL